MSTAWLYGFKNHNFARLLDDIKKFRLKCNSLLDNNESLDDETIMKARLFLADLAATSTIDPDDDVYRNNLILKLKIIIRRNYELKNETPEFISKYLEKE